MRVLIDEPRVVTTAGHVVTTGKRALPPLERMHRRGLVTWRQRAAAERLYASWSLGVLGARDRDGGGCTAWEPAGYGDAQLAAATDFREARKALGRLFRVVFEVVCEEHTCEEIARRDGAYAAGYAMILRLGLDQLADHYRFCLD